MNLGQPSKEHQQHLPYSPRASHASLFHPPRHQTIALGFLSSRLAASLISSQLAHSLVQETEAPVILVGFEVFEGSASSPHKQPEAFLNGEFHIPTRILPNEEGFYSLTLGIRSEDPPSPAGIASLLSHLSRHFRYVLIETPPDDRPSSWLTELLLRTDLAYLFLQPSTEEVYRLEVAVREVRTRSQNGGAHVKAIACLADGERIDASDLLAQRVAGPIHMFVRGCPKASPNDSTIEGVPTGSFAADIRRLAREISGRQLGLALSSGAAKGLAHIGVFQVLEENGIEVDVVAGASMGA